jgi:hypothetical protein
MVAAVIVSNIALKLGQRNRTAENCEQAQAGSRIHLAVKKRTKIHLIS